MNHPLIIAHRGNHENSWAPENTLEGFKGAWEAGADGVEIDCRLTRDGRVVLLHDPGSDRVGDRKLKVHASTLSELKKVEVVGRQRRFTGRGFRIPTLDEFCSALPDRGLVYLEIKVDEELFEPVAKVLVRYNLGPDRIRFIGFPNRPLGKLKNRFPEFDVYLLYGPSGVRTGGLRRIVAQVLRDKLDGIDLRITANFSETFADEIRRAGLRPHCYLTDSTLYNIETLLHVRSAGFDSITTDRPHTVKETRGEY